MNKPWDVLNIDKDASEKDIKKAYKQLAAIWHPDKNPKDKDYAEKKFKEISKAYEDMINHKNINLSDRDLSTFFATDPMINPFMIDPFDFKRNMFNMMSEIFEKDVMFQDPRLNQVRPRSN